MAKQPTYRDFFNRFPDDETCLEHLMRVRYGERHHCEKCGAEAKFHRVKKRRSYACEHCGHHVYPMAGTPFENTRTSLQDWFYVMHLFCSSRNGVSAKEVERQIGVTYKTAWRMCRLIREYMGQVDGDEPLGGPGRKPVESDKAYIGGYRKGDIGGHQKTIVYGAVERGGDVITKIVPNRMGHTVRQAVRETINPGARVFTDEGTPYNALNNLGYKQERVNHQKEEWARGEVHTNTIEGFWSQFQSCVRGTYVHVSRKWLHLYLDEFEFRYNLRKFPHAMFDVLLTGFVKPVCR